jgi:isopentenyl diphosphate isomerase/L-lactate dehydrogenase-like FMN-dependent dehydrogenase
MDKDGGYSEYHGSHFRPKTLDELTQFVRATKLPFIAKGILSEQDAYKCACAGCKGLVISHHHGGWGWDYAIPPLMVLPKIKKIIGDKMPIFVDCGVKDGLTHSKRSPWEQPRFGWGSS